MGYNSSVICYDLCGSLRRSVSPRRYVRWEGCRGKQEEKEKSANLSVFVIGCEKRILNMGCYCISNKWSACRSVTVRAKRNSSTHRALSASSQSRCRDIRYLRLRGEGVTVYEAKSASMEGSAVRHTHMSTNYEEIAQDALSKEQCCKKCCLLTKTSTFSEAS